MTSQPNPAAASLMQALHARFEANNAEYNAIEAARPAGDDWAERGKIDRATSASEYEADALRLAILTQVPDSSPDALILLFHIRIEQDAQANAHSSAPPSVGRKAVLQIAIDTLFDSMACETQFERFDAGEQMRAARDTVFYARRYRTGTTGA
ncbi:hypothetical protein U1872_18155 [Sphingomonas sp. RB3P16]|uniref:hypothetical protein n=1 Tax=Parasphingomonas frigoris TaxID=3096163 RepID=UPI002FCBD186